MRDSPQGERVRVISLGAGVQSSTMLLMAAEGRFGTPPELAIFADTKHEPPEVYEHLDWLEQESSIPVVRVSAGDLLAMATGRDFNPIPLYVRNEDGTSAIGRRQCTKEFKLYPIRHELRRRGLNSVEMWLGISVDEVHRMKPSGLQWAENRWPLVEERLSRSDCHAWFSERYPGRKLANSACYFCPYLPPREFARMRDEQPDVFAAAVKADEAMRDAGDGREQFVLRTMEPLADVSTPEDEGQLVLDWQDECEGMCGV